jgi:tungstate transport system ATP-binding protein
MVTMSASFQLEKIIFSRDGRRILGPITHSFSERGFTLVIGPNGAGKTSLLRLLHKLQEPDSGYISLPLGKNGVPQRQSFVFQVPILLHRSVFENAAYPLHLSRGSSAQVREETMHYLEMVGLNDNHGAMAEDLSGGQKQLLQLARALITRPKILILDEPTSNLDGRSTQTIEALLADQYRIDTRIIMTTQNVVQARRLASEVIFIHEGQIVESAEASAFFDKPLTPQASSFIQDGIVR